MGSLGHTQWASGLRGFTRARLVVVGFILIRVGSLGPPVDSGSLGFI